MEELRKGQAGAAAKEKEKAALVKPPRSLLTCLGCILPRAPKQNRCGQVARLEAELRGRVAACKSFSEVLQALCGVSAVNGGKDELGRAYKKALAKHHP